MKKTHKRLSCSRGIILAACSAALLLSPVPSLSSGEPVEPYTTSRETLRLGERIYREGILPSGKPLLSTVKGEASASGTNFTCGSCHLRSGLGALEENVYSPPVSGRKLFQPLYRVYKGVEQTQAPPLRPAYTDAALVTAIRSGMDAGGRVLNDVMPRYILEDRDATILVAYLKSLSSQFSPGVADTSIRFATVISDDAPPEEREAMRASLVSYFDLLNNQVNVVGSIRRAKARLMAENMYGSKDLAKKSINLSFWVLKGPAKTWRAQLEEYYRKEPVFCLVGGISNGNWQPVHAFCEDNHIPGLFPNTDFPVISDRDWYTLYLSKGYYQEGESVARYLAGREDALKSKTIVQIVRASREGQVLSTGFQHAWGALGLKAPLTITLPPEKTLNKEYLSRILSGKKPAVLIVWDDSRALPALESLAGHKRKPGMVFVSSRYLGNNVWTLKEQIRDITYLTYPYSFSPNVPQATMGKQKVDSDLQKKLKQVDVPLKDKKQRMTELTNAMSRLVVAWLADMKGNYYRDYLLDYSRHHYGSAVSAV